MEVAIAPEILSEESPIDRLKKWLASDDIQVEDIRRIATQVSEIELPSELINKLLRLLTSVNRQFGEAAFNASFDQIEKYIDVVTKLPWTNTSEDNLDIDRAHEILTSSHHGLESVKQRILEYIAILRLQKIAKEDPARAAILEDEQNQGHAAQSVLFFVGLPGIGKTSIAYSIAKAMNREFIRIPCGGMGSALQLRGEARTSAEAEPGQVIKGLLRAKTRNPVILLDEVDRTAEQARGQIMGVLLELLDPQQNFAFEDYYVDYPFNLSQVMFLASANNTGGISNAVLDRMELIKMPGYSDEEKIIIARDYLLPRQIKLTGMPADAVEFEPNVWTSITRPLGYDAGIRTMERTINSVVRKVALRMAEGRGDHFVITLDNIKEYMPDYL
ncbi:AAA family ATPase [candidate division WWE3 bacterium]|nr:AAA family ATPase [candidate division WWE3 bacterium]